ncbi:MAG: MBL fold metallo-hydrolase [Spirochaetales bacterium]|nr:MBL fold metallo-hydrolase [Spirochaetales bacterium]
MNIRQFRYGDSNLAYLVFSGSQAAAIDGGAADEILGFVEDNSLELKYVLNTHEHWDHIPGNGRLLKESEAEFISPSKLCEMEYLSLAAEELKIFPTPGHTDDSIVFGFDDCLITGDTLFNGTVGNCYTKDYENYFSSLCRILEFPPETRIFAGHDLVDYALAVAAEIDPENASIADYAAGYSADFVVSTLAMELAVNPFIRFGDSSLDNFRNGLEMPLGTPYRRWRAMMSVH